MERVSAGVAAGPRVRAKRRVRRPTGRTVAGLDGAAQPGTAMTGVTGLGAVVDCRAAADRAATAYPALIRRVVAISRYTNHSGNCGPDTRRRTELSCRTRRSERDRTLDCLSRLSVPIFPGNKIEPTISLVLTANARGIRNSGAHIQHQFERQPRLSADLVVPPIDIYLGRRPGVPAFRLIDLRYPYRRIEGRKLFLNGPHEQRAQILHQLVGRARRRPALVLAGLDVFLPERRIGQIAAVSQ